LFIASNKVNYNYTVSLSTWISKVINCRY